MTAAKIEDLIPLFYWDENLGPRDSVIIGIPALKRLALVGVLTKGSPIVPGQFPTYKKCLIDRCNSLLNLEEFTIWGYKYPKDSDHYILNHGIWCPDQCDALIEKAFKEMRARRRASNYL